MWPGVGMAWILVNVSPKISSQSAGWMARVYSSVRSWRILRSSTRPSGMTRLASRRAAASGVSLGISGRPEWPGRPGTPGSAETRGGAPGAADVTDASLLCFGIEGATGVVAEHVVQRGPAAQHGLEHARGTGDADRPGVHERDPVAVGIGLVHVVGRHQDGDRSRLAGPGDLVPDA